MRKEGKLAIGAGIVAGVGYLAGLLTAPRSGWRTRKKLSTQAAKARLDGEKQLKKLYSDLNTQLNEAEKKIKNAKKGTDKELKNQVAAAKKAKEKAKLILSALHNGDAADPDLKKTLADVKKAKANLAKFLKK